MGNNSGKERHGSSVITVDLSEASPTSPHTLTPTTWSPTTQLAPIINSPTRTGTNITNCESAQDVLSPPLISTNHIEQLEDCKTGLTNHIPEEVLTLTQVSGHIAQISDICVKGNTIVGATEVDAKLLQKCFSTLGLYNEESKYSLTDLLQCFLVEREKMKEELRCCKEKIQAEREEWKQFQDDLKVALVVSDRLREEAEEELSVLNSARQDWDRQLTDALEGKQNLESQLKSLKIELEQSRQKTKLVTRNHQGAPPLRALETSADKGNLDRYGKGIESAEKRKEEQLWTDEMKRKREMNVSSSTERSRLPSDYPAVVVNGTSHRSVTGTTDSDIKEENLILQTATSSVLDGPNRVNRRTQEDFSPALRFLRLHGGSKRNSLLRWCQGRTQGYKNIEITNFSSSWVDGLAFCAIYHSYLPSHIPYNTLSPENKKENLDLAFRTGEGFGISASLAVDEMLKDDAPDWHRVLEYVESIYRHFEM
ncbi:cytospin-A [Triplophysa dalaica]|uniref:cytospin-A n=1 Tax=Triplophysa dalaica TaxID=1582913 RepID=UPI0024E03832|nr:cytospin-A [Triplophysa dalaica]